MYNAYTLYNVHVITPSCDHISFPVRLTLPFPPPPRRAVVPTQYQLYYPAISHSRHVSVFGRSLVFRLDPEI